MKKLYGGSSGRGGGGSSSKRGKVHPSPNSGDPNHLTLLAALPAAMLTLTVALTAEDKEVLAYLISCGGERGSHLEQGEKAAAKRRRAGATVAESTQAPPVFECSCFRCYTSYWARWDASPNRQLIHEIIEAFEEENLGAATNRKTAKPARKGRVEDGAKTGRGGGGGGGGGGGEVLEEVARGQWGLDGGHVADVEDGEEEEEEEEEDNGEEGEERRSSVRRLVNYLGERIWGVWSL